MSFSKACLSYFAFYFTLYYSWTHHSSRGSCFLSREWQITPSGSHSLWSPLYVAATIIPCTTFKHILFALQFVQPGIITAALNPLFPPILLHSSGSVLSLAFSTPSREAFCVFYFFLFFIFFHVQSVVVLAKEQSAKAWIISAPTATLRWTLYISRWTQLLLGLFRGLGKACYHSVKDIWF